MLEGKTVWIVEPEGFTLHMLEAGLRDLRPKAIVSVGSLAEARTRLDAAGPHGAPQIAVIDFSERFAEARALADDLLTRGVSIVRIVPPNGLARGDGADGAAKASDVCRPYAASEVAHSIARHYGLAV